MSTPKSGGRILRSDEVRKISQPIMLNPMSGAESSENAMAIAPIFEEEHVVGIDIRCNCGSRVLVECIYEENQK